MLDLTGKVAFVTGSGSGIGEGTALALARAGAAVACTDLDGERAEATAAQVRALGREALAAAVDVRDLGSLEAAVAATAAQLGRLDIAVANAGISRGSNVLTLTEEDVDTVFDVNTKGVFLTVKACAREMVRRGARGTSGGDLVGERGAGGGGVLRVLREQGGRADDDALLGAGPGAVRDYREQRRAGDD